MVRELRRKAFGFVYLPCCGFICHIYVIYAILQNLTHFAIHSYELTTIPTLESSQSHQPQTAPTSRQSLECYFPQLHEVPEPLSL